MDPLIQQFELAGIPELQVALSLFAAALLGGLLGLERSIAGKHAGMRTYALVSLGSCLFVVVGTMASFQLSLFGSVNPLQIASSVVIGIGFIGAGLSSLRGDHAELTTASGVWVVAAIGMACGFGFYAIATVTTVIALIIFSFFSRLEHYLRVNYGQKNKHD